jgi:hypothetical protein
MESLKVFAVPLVVAIISISLTAYINIKVKFATDEKTAFQEVRTLFLKALSFILNIWIAYSLFKEITSPEPTTRMAVLLIVFYSLVLFWVFIANLLRDLIKIIKDIIGIQKRQLETTTKHLEVTHKQLDITQGASNDSKDGDTN